MERVIWKGVAIHFYPRVHAWASRKATIEALIGAPAGRVVERELIAIEVPTSFSRREAYRGVRYREHRQGSAGSAQPETTGVHENSGRENRIPIAAVAAERRAGWRRA